MAGQAYIQTEGGELVPLGVVDTGFSVAPKEAVTYLTKNFEASFSFKSNVLGNWDWLYPPRDELIDRLNNRLRGKAPAPAINTRYWRGL